MACKYYGNCEHQSGWCQSDSMLIKCTYGLNNLCSERILKIVRLEDENAELKRLLRLAVEDMKNVSDDNCCYHCIYGNPITRHCKEYKGNRNCYKWQHADEAMKLIGGDK